jgi:hypothetical protein
MNCMSSFRESERWRLNRHGRCLFFWFFWFPNSVWERPLPKLCFGPRPCGKQSFQDRSSQTEFGNQKWDNEWGIIPKYHTVDTGRAPRRDAHVWWRARRNNFMRWKVDELTEQVIRTAANAVEMSNRRGLGELDFSEASLSIVEQLVEEAAAYFEEMTPDQREILAQDFGCYILEVARREFGGQYAWSKRRDQPVLAVGEPKFRVALMTWDKVRGRLSGDPADNIRFLYTGFAERVRRAEPGTDVLYV